MSAADHIVELDLTEWREIYPQYPKVSDVQLQGLWDVACALIGNTPSSRIPYDPPRTERRKIILYATLCHLAYLATRGDVVGNVSNAAQGSVNVGLTFMQKQNSRWWEQSQCGATAWMLLAPHRSGGLYVSGR